MSCQLPVDGPPGGLQPAVAAAARARRLPAAVGAEVSAPAPRPAPGARHRAPGAGAPPRPAGPVVVRRVTHDRCHVTHHLDDSLHQTKALNDKRLLLY